MKQKALKFAKIAMLLLPLVVLFTNKKINFAEVKESFATLPIWIIPVSFSLLLIRIALQSLRFSVLTKAYTHKLHFWELFKTDMKAKYYSMVVPSSVGQDIVRGTLIKEHIEPDKILGISLLFRVTGIIPLILLSLIGLTNLSVSNSLSIPLWVIYPSFTALLILVAALFSEGISKIIFDKALFFLPEKIHNFGKKCVASIHEYKKHKKILISNLLLSVITQLLIVFFSSCILKALTGHFFLIESFFIFPIVEIIAILFPFSINGAGAREVQYLVLLPKLVSLSASQVPIFMTISTMLYFINLLGIFFILIDKITKKRSETDNE